MAVLLAIFGVITLVGVILTLKGLFPRRTGDTPYCRKCRYNLTGTDLVADDTRCPECGQFLNVLGAIVGERRRRPRRVAVGVVCFLLGIVPLGGMLYGAAAGVNWYQYKPTFMVIADLRSSNASLAKKAVNELTARHTGGKLSSGQLRSIADVCLEEQKRPKARPGITHPLVNLLGDLYTGGDLSPEQTQRLYRNVIPSVKLTARPTVVQGHDCAMRLEYQVRLPDWLLCASVAWLTVGLDGQTVQRGRSESMTHNWSAQTSTDRWLRLDEVGKHELAVDVEVTVYGQSSDRQKGVPPLHRRLETLTAPVEVLAEEPSDYIKRVSSPELDAAVASLVSIRHLEASRSRSETGQATFSLMVCFQPGLLAGLAFDVLVEVSGQEHVLGTATCSGVRAGVSESQVHVSGAVPVDLPKEVTIRLRSSTDAAERTVDLFEIWDGELRFENIPVSAAARPDGRFGDGRYAPTVRHPERSQSDAASDGEP